MPPALRGMARRNWPALLVVLVFAAGCAGSAVQPPPADKSRDPLAAAIMIPGERPVVASTVWHEAPRGDQVLGLQQFTGPKTWAPRDVNLTYDGINDAFDEWGRSAPAFVFRYQAMRYEIENVTIDAGGLHGQGRWVPVHYEYLFDASDGRFMGEVNLDSSSRSFAAPQDRDPVTWGYEGLMLLFVAIHVHGGDMTRPIAIGGGNITFSPSTSRPLPGDCDVYKLKFTPDHQASGPQVQDPTEASSATLICIQASDMVELWAWAGSPKNGISFARRGASFDMEAPFGKPMAPLVYKTEPWGQAGGNALMSPILVPQSHSKTDWSYKLQHRSEALFLSPGFLAYHAKHKSLGLYFGMTGWPFYDVGSILQAPVGLFDETTWLMTTEGRGMYWGDVYTRHAPPEQDEFNLADPQGTDFDFDQTTPYVPTNALPPLAPVGEVAHNISTAVHVEGNMTQFLVWPAFPGFDMGDIAAMWFEQDHCFQAKPQSPFVFTAGLSGRMLAAGYVQFSPGGCSAGGSGGLEIDTPSGPARLLDGPDHRPILALDSGPILIGPAPVHGLGTPK